MRIPQCFGEFGFVYVGCWWVPFWCVRTWNLRSVWAATSCILVRTYRASDPQRWRHHNAAWPPPWRRHIAHTMYCFTYSTFTVTGLFVVVQTEAWQWWNDIGRGCRRRYMDGRARDWRKLHNEEQHGLGYVQVVVGWWNERCALGGSRSTHVRDVLAEFTSQTRRTVTLWEV